MVIAGTTNEIVFRVRFGGALGIGVSQDNFIFEGKIKSLKIKGRHDACVVPRAVPIVESMLALSLVDHYLRLKKIIMMRCH